MVKNLTEISNPVEGKIDEIIEYFVKVYGEKHREKITERINNIEFIWINSNEKEEQEKKLASARQKLLTEFFHNVVGSNRTVLINKGDFENITEAINKSNFKLIKNYRLVYILFDLDEDFFDESLSFQNQYLTENSNSLLNRINYLKSIWDSQFSEKYAFISENKEKLSSLREDLYRDWQIKDAILYQHMEKHIAEKISNVSNADFVRTYRIFKSFFNNINASSMTPTRRSEFVKLCKQLGFNYGEKFDHYLNPEVTKYFCDEKLIKLKQEADFAHKKMIIMLSSFDNNLKQLNSLDILGGNLLLAFYIFGTITNSSDANAFCSYFITNSGQKKAICVLPKTASDRTILHEIGHAIQYHVLVKQNDFNVVKTGISWGMESKREFGSINSANEMIENLELIKKDIDAYIKNASNKFFDYAYFCMYSKTQSFNINSTKLNEVLNEYLTQLAIRKLHKDNYTINTSAVELGCSYSYAFSLLEEFFDKHKQKLIDCAMSGSVVSFDLFVGIENSQKLKKLINKFFNLPGIYEYLDNINASQQNENFSLIEYAKTHIASAPDGEKEYPACYVEMDKILTSIEKYIKLSEKNTKDDKVYSKYKVL